MVCVKKYGPNNNTTGFPSSLVRTLVPIKLSMATTQLRASSYLRNANPLDWPVSSSRTKWTSSTCNINNNNSSRGVSKTATESETLTSIVIIHTYFSILRHDTNHITFWNQHQDCQHRPTPIWHIWHAMKPIYQQVHVLILLLVGGWAIMVDETGNQCANRRSAVLMRKCEKQCCGHLTCLFLFVWPYEEVWSSWKPLPLWRFMKIGREGIKRINSGWSDIWKHQNTRKSVTWSFMKKFLIT